MLWKNSITSKRKVRHHSIPSGTKGNFTSTRLKNSYFLIAAIRSHDKKYGLFQHADKELKFKTYLNQCHLKPHHTAAVFAELDADQVDGFMAGAVFVGIACTLLQCLAFLDELVFPNSAKVWMLRGSFLRCYPAFSRA